MTPMSRVSGLMLSIPEMVTAKPLSPKKSPPAVSVSMHSLPKSGISDPESSLNHGNRYMAIYHQVSSNYHPMYSHLSPKNGLKRPLKRPLGWVRISGQSASGQCMLIASIQTYRSTYHTKPEQTRHDMTLHYIDIYIYIYIYIYVYIIIYTYTHKYMCKYIYIYIHIYIYIYTHFLRYIHHNMYESVSFGGRLQHRVTSSQSSPKAAAENPDANSCYIAIIPRQFQLISTTRWYNDIT